MTKIKHCIVSNCKISNEGHMYGKMKLVQLPKDEHKLKKWLQILERMDLFSFIKRYEMSLGKHYVCSRHFPQNSWTAKGNIKRNATPVRFPEVELTVDDRSHTAPPCEEHVGTSTSNFQKMGLVDNTPVSIESIEEIPEIEIVRTSEAEFFIKNITATKIDENIGVIGNTQSSIEHAEDNSEIEVLHASEAYPALLLKAKLKRIQKQYDLLLNQQKQCKEENKRKLADKDRQLAEKDRQLADKDRQIAKYAKQMQEMSETIQKLMQNVQEARKIDDDRPRCMTK